MNVVFMCLSEDKWIIHGKGIKLMKITQPHSLLKFLVAIFHATLPYRIFASLNFTNLSSSQTFEMKCLFNRQFNSWKFTILTYNLTCLCDSKESEKENASIHHWRYWGHRFLVLFTETFFSGRSVSENTVLFKHYLDHDGGNIRTRWS